MEFDQAILIIVIIGAVLKVNPTRGRSGIDSNLHFVGLGNGC